MIEETKEFKDWAEMLEELNQRINALTIWDDYAESLQARYDRLLDEYPILKEKKDD